MTDSERLFTRPSTLTDAERERARAAFEQAPSILDSAILAALGHADDRIALIEGVLRGLRDARSS
jgi:hypothetical protein